MFNVCLPFFFQLVWCEQKGTRLLSHTIHGSFSTDIRSPANCSSRSILSCCSDAQIRHERRKKAVCVSALRLRSFTFISMDWFEGKTQEKTHDLHGKINGFLWFPVVSCRFSHQSIIHGLRQWDVLTHPGDGWDADMPWLPWMGQVRYHMTGNIHPLTSSSRVG